MWVTLNLPNMRPGCYNRPPLGVSLSPSMKDRYFFSYILLETQE